ncbi:hypothetical protein HZB01_00010 [Candidatus Woesearchaeota archaeon]|nr:hypothetical protein [Candidatus Woesearchaeota archaeon]
MRVYYGHMNYQEGTIEGRPNLRGITFIYDPQGKRVSTPPSARIHDQGAFMEQLLQFVPPGGWGLRRADIPLTELDRAFALPNPGECYRTLDELFDKYEQD